jgi:phosphoglycerate dehydrogenase-like enzyme
MLPTVHVLSTGRFSDAQLDRLRAVSSRLRIEQTPTRDFSTIAPQLAEAEVLYTYVVPATLLEQAPRLRWVQLALAGADHLVGHPLLTDTRIRVTTTSGIHGVPIAEYVMACLLSLGRLFPRLMDLQRRAEWPRDRWYDLRAKELHGATLGIIGYGSIGREVARLARCFGMRILALKRRPAQTADAGYAPAGQGDPAGELPAAIYGPEQLHDMLAQCDCVVVTAPLTPATRGMLDAAALRAMKRDAFLVNVSRGAIIVEDALIQALKEGWIAGAALDVFAQEPLPADSELWRLENVILTPHVSATTPAYEERASILFAENLRRYLAGEPLLNLLDPNQGY